MSICTKPLNVLIVEDEALLAMDIGAMIEDCGHHVIAEAASLREVEALPAGTRPDLAFVDLHLDEGSSGLDVSTVIRDRWHDAVIIFLTANPTKIPRDFAAGHGVIAKPFSRNGLMTAIRYIESGVCASPRGAQQPASFQAFPALAAVWNH